mmetsp:Transcript_114747/g.244858  ORF Transcript_114747/g.244858 Transcript_114747/m.244858 type:complete len:200 (-) Transcript_114747:2145-2744(-)
MHWRIKFAAHELVEEQVITPTGPEVLVAPDVSIAMNSSSQALLLLAAEQARHQASADLVLVPAREPQRCLKHRLTDLHGVVAIVREGEVTADKFEEQDTQGPDVDLDAVAASLQHIRSHVVGCTDDGEGLTLALSKLLRDSKIHQLQIAVLVQHHIFRLEISVHDSSPSELLENEDQGARVELRLGQGEHCGYLADRTM